MNGSRISLVLLLLALNLAGERLEFTIRGQDLSAGFVALVLAMTLLGPAPAVAIGVCAMVLTTATRRTSAAYTLGNLSSHALFPLVGRPGRHRRLRRRPQRRRTRRPRRASRSRCWHSRSSWGPTP